ncbi:MAG: signal peptide peptidase SppA [Deltaproteobacteria bacterium]|nr:signal peptide peptidase SppA [Deltaproteobacteria bacterium]
MANPKKRKWIVVCVLLVSFFLLIKFLFTSFLSEETDYAGARPNSIAILKVEGIITESEEILEKIRNIKENKNIKAVIIRINSPGGLVAPSQEIYRELKRLKEDNLKFVVASMETIAASGGYYIACAADTIVASPGTLTASIGVKMDFANLEEFYKWAKIKPYTLTSGKFKNVGSPNREMSSEEKKLLQDMIENIYQQFKNTVLESRKEKIDEQKLSEVADGRVMTGEQAHQVGLVDSLGTLEDAVYEAQKLAGITGKPHVIYPKKKKHSLLSYILESENLVENITSRLFLYTKTLPAWMY